MGLRADRSGSKTVWTAEACVAAAWACQAAAVALRDGTSICGEERAAVVQFAGPLGAVNTERGFARLLTGFKVKRLVTFFLARRAMASQCVVYSKLNAGFSSHASNMRSAVSTTTPDDISR